MRRDQMGAKLGISAACSARFARFACLAGLPWPPGLAPSAGNQILGIPEPAHRDDGADGRMGLVDAGADAEPLVDARGNAATAIGTLRASPDGVVDQSIE